VPEEWLACVKETLRASRAERDKTGGMCAHVKRLLRESSNEIWQRFNVASNAINANIDRIHSERRATLSQLAMVSSSTPQMHQLHVRALCRFWRELCIHRVK